MATLSTLPTYDAPRKVKYIDLFCGMGSFHYSFQKLGFECVMACDISAAARENYKANFQLEPHGDICAIVPSTLPEYDILCAGFPCQPFSQAGHHRGFDDERGSMFAQIMRFVSTNHPSVVVLENVPALAKHDGGATIARIKSDLQNEGYTTIHSVLKCSDYAIPQMRKRLFIVGFKVSQISVINIDAFFHLDSFKRRVSLSEYLGKAFEKTEAYTLRCGGKHTRIGDRHNWDGYVVDGREYRLTLDDGLLLQGFENYNLIGRNTDKWKLLGNTIPTVFTRIIGSQILKHTSLGA
jgi:DNA (cytosine-5)-methyltransferase 1